MPFSRAVAAPFAILALTLGMTSCGESDSGNDNAPASEGMQRDALDDAWGKTSTDGRRGACDQFAVDAVGFSSEYFGNSFNYDVVKDFMEDKC